MEPPHSSAPASPPALSLRAEARELLIMGFPLILAQLAQISMNTADTVMAGRLSAHDLAAVALGGAIWTPVWILSLGVLLSVGPTCSQLFGAGRIHEIGPQVRQGLWLSQFLAWVMVAVVWHSDQVLTWFEVSDELIPTTVGYMRAIVWGMPAICAQCVLRGFTEAIGRTRPILGISLSGFFANICGNWVLMYGHFGLPKMGAIGTGVASAASMWLMFLTFALWIRWRPEYRPYQVLSHIDPPHRQQIFELIRLGLPIGIGLFMEGTLFTALSLFLGEYGSKVIAGHQAALNISSVTFMMPLGLAIALGVRVGHAIGRGDPQAARRAGFVGIGLCMLLMLGAAILLLSIPRLIGSGYTQDAEVLALIGSLLPLVALTQLFDGIQVAAASALRGLKDTMASMVITTAAYWGIGLTLAWWLAVPQKLAAHGVWWGFVAALLASSSLLTWRFHWKTQHLIRTRELAQNPLPQTQLSAELS